MKTDKDLEEPPLSREQLEEPPLSREQLEEPPLSREQLEELPLHQCLSLQQIAGRASEQLGVTISRPKVREWLLWHRLPRRSFAEAAQVKFEKRREASSI